MPQDAWAGGCKMWLGEMASIFSAFEESADEVSTHISTYFPMQARQAATMCSVANPSGECPSKSRLVNTCNQSIEWLVQNLQIKVMKESEDVPRPSIWAFMSFIISFLLANFHDTKLKIMIFYCDVFVCLCLWQWGTRPFNIWGTAVSRSYALCQRMLHYVQSFEHYMTLEVRPRIPRQ